MNNELTDELVITRLIERVQSGNVFILRQIGKTINQIRELTPSQARKLQQMIKYGDSYREILEKLSKITNLNKSEIDQIFKEYAKKDYQFAERFYKYRNIDYVPFEDFKALKTQVQAISNITKQTYMNFSKTSVIGFTIRDLSGNGKFYKLGDAYQYAVDQALLSITQGKDNFDHQMYSILKSLGESGIRTVDYQSGKTRRLDSALRMSLREGIRNLHNETQRIIGNEFGADGVEITVHEYPAPDHQDLQGRQFSFDEFDKLQNNLPATDYKGITYIHEHRPISKLNCYHNARTIVLGVNEPQYTNEQLDQIKQRNDKGFDFEGKHYNMYQGTQLQRRLETEVRKQKDVQILAREANNKQLINDAQQKITYLTNKYKKLSQISDLETKMERMRVSRYRRVKVD